MRIRQAEATDLAELLSLYLFLHEKTVPDLEDVQPVWQEILADKNHFVLVGEINHQLIASCVVVIIPNLTRNQRPYALIENVVTHGDFRKKGYGSQLLQAAKKIAKEHHCYKLMLMTGAKDQATLAFYERSGSNATDKTAFFQWLDS